jgi:hypothetical protein
MDSRVETCNVACGQWARGEITIEELKKTRRAATYVADATAYAADAAYAAAYAADAAYAAAYAAKSQTLATCADIVRRHYPVPPRWNRT